MGDGQLTTDRTFLKRRSRTSEKEPKTLHADLQVLREEIEQAICSLKDDKAPGVDKAPVELLKYGGEETVKVLTDLCGQIWETNRLPKEWTQSLIILLPKWESQRQCQNYLR